MKYKTFLNPGKIKNLKGRAILLIALSFKLLNVGFQVMQFLNICRKSTCWGSIRL